MKLQRFNEYSDNTDDDIEIPFNDNEIAYLEAKGIFGIDMGRYIVNSRIVKKLKSGEFLVVTDKVKCSTIQSLLKYTAASTKEIEQYILHLINNSVQEKIANHIYWHFKDHNKAWAYEYFLNDTKYFYVYTYIMEYMEENIKDLSSGEYIHIIQNIINQIDSLKGYKIKR